MTVFFPSTRISPNPSPSCSDICWPSRTTRSWPTMYWAWRSPRRRPRPPVCVFRCRSSSSCVWSISCDSQRRRTKRSGRTRRYFFRNNSSYWYFIFNFEHLQFILNGDLIERSLCTLAQYSPRNSNVTLRPSEITIQGPSQYYCGIWQCLVLADGLQSADKLLSTCFFLVTDYDYLGMYTVQRPPKNLPIDKLLSN